MARLISKGPGSAALVCLFLAVAASRASAQPIERHGFTLGLSLGGGSAIVAPKNGTSSNKGGVGGLNLAIGGFVSPDMALLFKATVVNFGSFDNSLSTGEAGVGAVAVEYWLSDHFNLVGGVGLGALELKPKNADRQSERGLGLQAGLNWFPFAVKHHGLGIYADISPLFTSNYAVVTYQAGFAWQYY